MKNVGPTFFSLRLPQCNPFQSCPFESTLLFVPFAVFLLCCSTVSSGYCNVSFYFLGILGVMWKYIILKFTVCSNCENTAEEPSNPSRPYHQLSTLKRNIHLPFGITSSKLTCFPIQCYWDVSKELNFDKKCEFLMIIP